MDEDERKAQLAEAIRYKEYNSNMLIITVAREFDILRL